MPSFLSLCRANVCIYSYPLRQSTVILDMMFWSLRIKYNLHASATPRFSRRKWFSFLILSQKILGSTGCFKQEVPINSMKLQILTSFLYYVRYINGFLIESSEPSNMLVCFYVANLLLVPLEVALLLWCSAEAPVQPDRSAGAGRRLHPLKTRSDTAAAGLSPHSDEVCRASLAFTSSGLHG